MGKEGEFYRVSRCACEPGACEGDAPDGANICTSCAAHERGIAAGIFRAMKRGCLTWDRYEHCFVHLTVGDSIWGVEVVQDAARLAEIGRGH